MNNYIEICDIIILTLEHTWDKGWVGPTPKKMGFKKIYNLLRDGEL